MLLLSCKLNRVVIKIDFKLSILIIIIIVDFEYWNRKIITTVLYLKN